MSGSIDKSVKLHVPSATLIGKYDFDKEFTYHESFVYALTPEIMANGFFSGSKDQKIYHVDAQGNPARIFSGHDGPVSSLCQAVPEELVSGSWDGTARIWDTATGSCKKVLEAGAHAVTVLALPNGVIITGSQDKTIRIWFQGELQHEVPNAHGDIIRQFAEVPGVGFVSCSNDELVKLWTLDGKPIRTFSGHQGFVFTVACLASGEIASGGDDCSVKIWDLQSGKCKQTIALPRTVWSVVQNEHGDLLIGTEDYKVRSFTRDHDRKADAAEQKEFEEELVTKSTAADMDQFAKAPDVSEQSKIQGKTEGDIQVFKKNGVPCAYMWKTVE